MAARAPGTWWREGVLYQVYPRSFQDSNGDGIGDLRGVIARLDHLAWLGVDGIWLNPTFPSPDRDWGYDVADYTAVHPDLGTLEDLDALVAEAGRRDIRVLLDLVPNHTSDQHPWFAEHPDYYVWADGDKLPNNWRSIFDGGPAWTRHANGRWYLRLFLAQQPDLDWFNPAVAEEFDAIVRFWLDRGVAGFRIDVCQAIVKDRELRDDPGHSANRPEVHDVMRRWRALTDGYEDRVLVGETYVHELDQLMRYYGDGADELHLAFNIPFLQAPLDAARLRAIVEDVEAGLPPGAWPVWTGSNHDAGRLATRWARGDAALARCALVMLLTLRGTPFLYYGDEIGLCDVPIREEAVRDHAGGRDGGRTPMPWTSEPGGGFTTGAPWLPLGDGPSVAAQIQHPSSTLHLVRSLIDLRRAQPDLRTGAYATVPAPDGVWAWRRGEDWTVALNLGEHNAELTLSGRIAVGTNRARDGEELSGTIRLRPAEAVVVFSGDDLRQRLPQNRRRL